jgi:hypothetical protein
LGFNPGIQQAIKGDIMTKRWGYGDYVNHLLKEIHRKLAGMSPVYAAAVKNIKSAA